MSAIIRSVFLLLGLGTLALASAPLSAQRYLDPPSRVARLSYVEGVVTHSPAGEGGWYDAMLNRPLLRGDALYTDRRGRAELQLGGAALRLNRSTSLEILELEDHLVQIQLSEGSVHLSVRRILQGESYEIATPTLALVIDEPGSYRVDVGAGGAFTDVTVWGGGAEAYGDRARFAILEDEAVRFYDPRLRDYELFALPRPDRFDRFAFEREARWERSGSRRYVSEGMIGYEDLDYYGSWSTVREHGAVWYPREVAVDWAPYRHGRWIWQDPWGWTWVDDAPWGFAPFHYGRWAYVGGRWGWVPGPRQVRAVYAPALVAFFGGSSFRVGVSVGGSGPIGWFPLGPREVYVPPYYASRDYFTRVNVSNTVINTTQVVNIYNNYYTREQPLTRIDYAYRSLSQAITAVPSQAFVDSQPVQRSALRVDPATLTRAEVRRVASIAPSERSLRGGAGQASARPAREVIEREVVARTAPPADVQPFSARLRELQQAPGRPIAREAARAAPRSEDVRVVGGSAPLVDRARDRGRGRGESRGRQALPEMPRGDAPPAARREADETAPVQRERAPEPRREPAEQGRQREVDQAERRRDEQTQQVERRPAEQARQRAAEQQEQRREAEQAEQARQRGAEQQERRRQGEQAEQARQRAAEQQEQRREAEQTQQRAAEQQQRRQAEQAEQGRQRAAEQQEQRRQAEQAQRRAAEQQARREQAEQAERARQQQAEQAQQRAAEQQAQREQAERARQQQAEQAQQRAAEQQARREQAEQAERAARQRQAEQAQQRAAEQQARREQAEQAERARQQQAEQAQQRAAEQQAQREQAERARQQQAEQAQQRAAEQQQQRNQAEQAERARQQQAEQQAEQEARQRAEQARRQRDRDPEAEEEEEDREQRGRGRARGRDDIPA